MKDNETTAPEFQPHNYPQRYWINQPSTLQPFHELSGMNVLCVPEIECSPKDGGAIRGIVSETHMRAYFLSGDKESIRIPKLCLSKGWLERKPENDVSPVTMGFEDTARIARNILSESGWDVNDENWFRHDGSELDFKINVENETFTLEPFRHPKQEMTVKETIDWLESWKG